jgi:hypothetical protein
MDDRVIPETIVFEIAHATNGYYIVSGYATVIMPPLEQVEFRLENSTVAMILQIVQEAALKAVGRVRLSMSRESASGTGVAGNAAEIPTGRMSETHVWHRGARKG